MSLFINSTDEARSPGAYAIDIVPPQAIESNSLGFFGYLGQFDWGPVQQVVTPSDRGDFLNTFEPAGAPRTSSGYRGLMGRKKVVAKIVRVLASDAIAASAAITGTGGTITVTAKYKGTLGNNITVTFQAASGGDATKRDIVVKLTDATTGTTAETYRDQSLPGSNVAGAVDVTGSRLLASIAIASNASPAWPSNGTTSLSSGSNGSALASSDYVGTQGAADKGVALFENENDVLAVCCDGFADAGSLTRAGVNTGLALHRDFMGDRVAVLDTRADTAGTDAWSAVKGYVTSTLIDDGVVFCGAYGKVRDDALVLQQSPLSSFIATALTTQTPQKSHAQWADETTDLYAAMEDVVAAFSVASPTITGEATDRGIELPKRLPSGRFAMLHDRTTSQTSGKRFTVRKRLDIYLAKSLLGGLVQFVNAPNLASNARKIKGIVDAFLTTLLKKEFLVAASSDISAAAGNTPSALAAGQFFVAIDAQTPAPMEKIFFLLNVGEGVVVRNPIAA